MSTGNRIVNRTTRKHRTLWISDVHLGSPGSRARELTEFLRQNDCETLYLVGDIFDGWKMKQNFYWTADHSRVIKAVIAKARKGTKVHYLAGNHDSFMRQFVRRQLRLGHIRIGNEAVHTTADGRRLLVMHGDAFDLVMTDYPALAMVGDVGYELLMRSNKVVNRVRGYFGLPFWSLSAFTKDRVKSAVQYLSGFDEKVLHRCRIDGYQGVICGHTHHAEARYLREGVTSYNCGDWVESCTALAEDQEGYIEILDGLKSIRPKAAPAHPATVTQPRRLWRLPVPKLRPVAAKASRRAA
jgi:UDP-2,3-diacylglucosamine pyrophosphatase LpxH